MGTVTEVEVGALDIGRLSELIGPERAARFAEQAALARAALTGRAVVNVNSTATGGGVAEMLQTLLASVRGIGIDTRWLVIQGNPAFFAVTKRIHNGVYGTPGDGGPLGLTERQVYEETLQANEPGILRAVRPGVLVLLHDPQTAGLADAIRRAGAKVVWRCHIGLDHRNEHAERAWAFLRPYVEDADAFVFHREPFAPLWVNRDRLHVIPPSIDPFAAKNQDLGTREDVRRVLRRVGLLPNDGDEPVISFARRDGSTGALRRHEGLLLTGPPPPADVPLVLQVSRWDRLKDMEGVIVGFAEHAAEATTAHLLLAGPSVAGVSDDPEGDQVLAECVARWRGLPDGLRDRVHLACLPMDDVDENAAITNALQRHCTIAVQKSLAEGFGLTVAEAMWKARPVVAGAVGGIVDQVVDGETGILLPDPSDLAAFGAALRRLLEDPATARRMGEAGRRRAHEEFLGDRHLTRWGSLALSLTAR